MKRYNSTLIKMTRRLGMAIAALLMLSTMASCSDQDSQAPATGDEAYLNLSFSTASATTSRAGGTGNIGNDETQANPNAESDIHSIKVWVFKSGTKGEEAKPIAYKEDTPSAVDGKPANGTYTLNLRFLRKINGEELKNIDLYILANSESTNMAKKLEGKDLRSITREDLQKVTFDKPFGITKDGKAETTEVPNGKAQTTEVPNGKGLPISRAITNIAIAGHVADTEIKAKEIGIKIPLVRAVSKLHFYFARKDAADAMTENVKVTGIEIDGKTFPTASYVFPDEEEYTKADANKAATSSKYGTLDYEPTALQLPGVENSGIAAVADPTAFIKKDSQTAQEYLKAFEDAGIKSHHLSYLRDTNISIPVKITYQLADGSIKKTKEISIPSNGNANRNRELVVYGYFLQGGALELNVLPTVLPWETGAEYTFNDAISIKTNIEKNGENSSQIAFNNARYGPKIWFTEMNTNGKSWVLQTDSPDYGFIDAEKVNPDGSYDLADVMTVITGNGATTKVDPFYVVPRSVLDYTQRDNYTCHVYMVAYSPNIYSPNMKVIINAPSDGSKGTATGTGTETDMVFTQVK